MLMDEDLGNCSLPSAEGYCVDLSTRINLYCQVLSAGLGRG